MRLNSDVPQLNEKKRIWAPQAIASLLLLIALNPENPYGYYIFLRWVVCGIFVYLAFYAIKEKKNGWAWTLGITALIYNPFFLIHFGRTIWTIVNVITIGAAAVSIPKLGRKEDE